MWSCKVLLLLVVAASASAANVAWKPGVVYKYRAEARTLTAIHQVDDQYTGILIKGDLEIRPSKQNLLFAKLSQPKYASVQVKLPGGWNSHIPERYLNMKPLPLSGKPFEIKLENGLVAGLVVSKSVPTWEVNMLKSVVSQLQVNTEGKDLVPGGLNNKPNHTSPSPNAVFRSMEDSITGKCEVLYDIAPLPSYLVLDQPQLAPLVKNIAETPLIEIVKTQNFSNCDRRIAFNFGFPGSSEFQHPDGNQASEFLARSSVSRIIISGLLHRYTIQSSVSTSKVIISPLLYNKQKSMVVSSWNLTLASIRSTSGSSQPVTDRKEIKSLGYSYENVFNYKTGYNRAQSDASSSSSSSSTPSRSSSSLSEELYGKSISRSSSEEDLASVIRRSKEEESKSLSGSQSSIWKSNQENSEDESQASNLASKNPSKWYLNSQEESQERSYYGGMRLKRAIHKRERFTRDSRLLSSEQDRSEASGSVPASRDLWSSGSSQENSTEMSWNSEFKTESGEESTYLPLPPITEPLSLPFLPLFAGLSGKPLSQKINVVEFVKKMSIEIANDASNANFMVKQNTLAKFSIITDVIRTMSTKQLQAVTSSLYSSQSSSSASESQNIRIFAWRVFRDAVAEAGTSPALMVLKDWIWNSKVGGDEAAWLIAVLPSSAMMPNAKYLHELFKIVLSPKVKQQLHLNVTALLAFSNLVRMSLIDNATAHKYYPIHAYGRPASRSDTTWQDVYVPQLKKLLEDAIYQNDSVKIQAYTSAIGAIGHPLILKIFEPYLERKVNITTFQRTLMVVSMSHLVKVYPEIARQVLFKLYQNTAESHEVRCAAVLLLLSTNPPSAMLQRMAEFTNYDAHVQVNAVVKSGLQSLANLEGSANRELALAAKSAVNMLNSSLSYKQYSSSNIRSSKSEQYPELSYMQVVNYIGSDDTIVPKLWYYNVTRNFGGFKQSHLSFAAMASSVSELIKLLKARTGISRPEYESESESEYESRESSPLDWEAKFTPQHISKLLGIKLNKSEPLEGNVMFKFAGLSRFFAFDSHTIQKYPEVLQDIMAALSSERNFNITKYFDQFKATLAFPVVTGLPFVYTLKTPSVISIGGKSRVRTQWEEQIGSVKAINASGQLNIWYSSKVQAELGFVTPFDNQHYISGVYRDTFINVPARAKVDVDLKNTSFKLTVEPIHQEQKSTLLYYSSAPFIVRHNILNLKPLQEESNYELIVNNEFSQMESTFGERSVGMSFRVQYNTSGNANSLPSKLEEAKRDPLLLLYFPYASKEIKYENMSFSLIRHRSSPSSIVVRGTYGSKYHSLISEELSSSEESSWYHPKHKKSKSSLAHVPLSNSQRRISEFLEKVSSGIKNSSATVVDLSVQFPGEKNAEFMATAAWATSPVDENSRIVASYYQKPASELERPTQVCFDMTSKAPYVPLLDYKAAIKATPYISADASLNIGETCSAGSRIVAQVKLSQSKERKNYVSQHPMAQLCESQMSEGNNALPACRNVTAEANYMDQLDIHVKYNSLPTSLKNITYKSYSALLSLIYPYVDQNVFIENPLQDQIKLKVKLSPNLKELNASLESPIVVAKLERFPLGPVSGPLLAVHPVYSAAERLSRVVLGDQYNAKCTIGNTAVNTFDNNTYPVLMGKCWHVMLELTPWLPNESEFTYVAKHSDVAVLVRDSGSLKKDVKLLTGKDVIDLTPYSSRQEESRGYASGKVRVNGVSLKVSSNNVTNIYNDHGAVWVEIFNLPSGEISLRYPIHGLWVLYDGQTIQLSANDSYKGNMRGLCGTFDGEHLTDFTTPGGVVTNDTQQFSASYSLPDECQGPVASIRRKAFQHLTVRPSEFDQFNVIDDGDFGGGSSDSSSSHSSSSHQSDELSSNSHEHLPRIPTVFRTEVIVDGSQLCFSVNPLPTCAVGSHATSRVQKNIAVYCINSSNPTAKKLRAMIESGANPDLRRKGATKYLKVNVPKTCARN